MSTRRRRHRLLEAISSPTHGYITNPIHQEWADGFCLQINYSGDAIQSVIIRLEGSVDYNIAAEGTEKWTELETIVCSDTSGFVVFNVPKVYVPFYRVTATVTAGTPLSLLEIYEFAREVP